MKVDDRKFVRAHYPWNEELAREAKADTPHHEPIKEKPVETAAFEYSIEIACTLDELNTYQVGAFSLGKTKEEERISLWTKSQTDKGFSLLTASVKMNEPKSLTREFFISSGHSVTFNDVSPVKKGAGTHAESFVPIKPSIQIYDRLAWPKVGFFYHFINDELENEYRLSGGDKWSFKVTYSKGKELSSDLLSEHEYAFILLPWKINNTVISRQHLLYTKEKMTQEQLSEINAQWLDESACLINPDEVVTARSDKIVMREQEDNGRITYTVQSGDTLGLIAKKQGITYDGLLALNPQITNPDLIQVGDVITIKDVPSEQESIQFHVCKISSETGQRETWGEIAEQHGMGAKELYVLNADNPTHKDGALALDNELRVKNTAQNEAPDVVYRNAQSPEDVSGDKWVFSFANVWSVIEKPFSDVAHMFVQDDTALNKNTSVIKVNSIRLHSKILSGSDGLESIAQEKKGAIKKGDKDAPKSNEIKTIQKALLALNFDLGKYGADGDFGSGTEQVVMDFQREFVPTHEVHAEYEIKESDGVMNSQTLLALDEAVAIKWAYLLAESSSDRTFRDYFKVLLMHEGGFVNDPDDLGGATNKGITYKTLNAYAKSVLRLEPSMELLKNLTDEQAYLIYKTEYWDTINGDDIVDRELAFQIFDFKMNAGKNGIKTLQNCLNENFEKTLSLDGAWGKETLSSVNSVDSKDLYIKYREYRIEYYKDISVLRPQNQKFLKGWINRANSFNTY